MEIKSSNTKSEPMEGYRAVIPAEADAGGMGSHIRMAGIPVLCWKHLTGCTTRAAGFRFGEHKRRNLVTDVYRRMGRGGEGSVWTCESKENEVCKLVCNFVQKHPFSDWRQATEEKNKKRICFPFAHKPVGKAGTRLGSPRPLQHVPTKELPDSLG